MSHDLVMRFIDQSDSFVHGYECGLLAASMERHDSISQRLLHNANIQQVEMMAARYGYVISKVEPVDDDWCYITASIDPSKLN